MNTEKLRLRAYGVKVPVLAKDLEISIGHCYGLLNGYYPMRNVYRRAIRDFLREKTEEKQNPKSL